MFRALFLPPHNSTFFFFDRYTILYRCYIFSVAPRYNESHASTRSTITSGNDWTFYYVICLLFFHWLWSSGAHYLSANGIAHTALWNHTSWKNLGNHVEDSLLGWLRGHWSRETWLTNLFDNKFSSNCATSCFLSDDESKGWPAPLDLHYWDCFSISSSQWVSIPNLGISTCCSWWYVGIMLKEKRKKRTLLGNYNLPILKRK